MLREIIEIDQSLCDGCGDCVPACHEGALQIIDNKAHLISDLMCDGLGALPWKMSDRRNAGDPARSCPL